MCHLGRGAQLRKHADRRFGPTSTQPTVADILQAESADATGGVRAASAS
jgi:hypothetical protein